MADDALTPLPSPTERELSEAEKVICCEATDETVDRMIEIYGARNLTPHIAMVVIGLAAAQVIDAFPNATPDEKAYAAEVVKDSIDAMLRSLAAAAVDAGTS